MGAFFIAVKFTLVAWVSFFDENTSNDIKSKNEKTEDTITPVFRFIKSGPVFIGKKKRSSSY